MAALKTKVNNQSVTAFLNQVKDKQKKDDALALLKLMKTVTGERPKMWGPSIVGFGMYHYQYASGQQGDWPLVAFSPRAQSLTLYIMSGFKSYASLVKKLGQVKTGKSCLYIKRLEDIDKVALSQLIKDSFEYMKKKHN